MATEIKRLWGHEWSLQKIIRKQLSIARHLGCDQHLPVGQCNIMIILSIPASVHD